MSRLVLLLLAVLALGGCTVSTDSPQQTTTPAPVSGPPTPAPLWQQGADRFYDRHPNLVADFCDGVEDFGEAWSFYHWKKNYADPAFARKTFQYALERCGVGVSV